MAGIECGFWWKGGLQQCQALHHVGQAAPFEVGASDAQVEKGVASEGYVLLLAEEDTGAGCVAWGMDDAQLMVAEVDGVAVGQKGANGRDVVLEGEAEHL